MRILFIYAPFAHPVAPPAGVAYLKGFVQKNFPTAKIKCLDLNLDWYVSRFKLNKISSIKSKSDSSKKDYVESLNNFFKTKSKEEKYHKQFLQYLKNGQKNKEIKRVLEADLSKIKIFNPDVIGFSVQFKAQLPYSLALAKTLKKENKETLIIFGGGLFSPNSLPDANKLLEPQNPVDIIVRGNGELPLLRILKKFNKGVLGDLSSVSSIIYYDSSCQKVIKNDSLEKRKKTKEKTPDYREIPDYSNFNLGKYFSPKKVLSIKIAGGCSWGKCTFCQVSSNGPGFYPRPSQGIIEEIKQLKKKFGVTRFHFIASEAPKFLLDDIASSLIRNKIKITYSVYVRPVKAIDNDLLKKLYQSGCRLIDYGVESLTQRILDLMDKGTKTEDVLELLRRTKRAGINTFCWYIVGFPSQTISEIKKEINLLEKNFKYIDFFGCHPFYLKEATLIYHDKNTLISSKTKPPLLLKISQTSIFDDEELVFKVKKGISQEEAKFWADVISKKFTNFKKDGRYSELMKNFREFHILSSI